VVAYRYLAGAPPSADERAATLSAWEQMVNGPWNPDNAFGWGYRRSTPEERWLAIRDKMLGARKPEVDEYGRAISDSRFRKTGEYQAYLACPSDALETATRTYENRAARYTPALLKDWVAAQDMVFSNCRGGKTVPADARADAPALFKADRAYQIAAAQFYSDDFDGARARFEIIAQDAASPWHEIAPYLAARSLIRKATLVTPDDAPFDPATMAQAEQALRAIISNPKLKPMHAPARKLLGFVAFRLHPAERIQELGRALAGPKPDPDFEQDLIDYTMLLEKLIGGGPILPFRPRQSVEENRKRERQLQDEWNRAARQALSALRNNNDLSDWVLNFQDDSKDAAARALAKWKETRGTQWLVSAMTKADSNSPEAAAMIAAAEKISPRSPAFVMASHERLRLLIGRGEQAQARAVLDSILPGLRDTAPPSAVNQLYSQRMKVAANFAEFLHYAPRVPVAADYLGALEPTCEKPEKCHELIYGDTFTRKGEEVRFDTDAASRLNKRFPVTLLLRASTSRELPQHLQSELAVATWTRAALLGEASAAKQVGSRVAAETPALKPYLETYDREQTPEGRRFAAVFAVLHFPGMRPFVNASSARSSPLNQIDSFRDNWWCVDVGANIAEIHELTPAWERQATQNNTFFDPQPNLPSPSFLTASEKQESAAQWKALSQLGTAPNFLSGEVLKWAKAQPEDPRVPEALHYAVRSTRYGCENKDTSRFSRESFRLLHSRYSKSEWAKKTRYWF
jgi:hypothetical protein